MQTFLFLKAIFTVTLRSNNFRIFKVSSALMRSSEAFRAMLLTAPWGFVPQFSVGGYCSDYSICDQCYGAIVARYSYGFVCRGSEIELNHREKIRSFLSSYVRVLNANWPRAERWLNSNPDRPSVKVWRLSRIRVSPNPIPFYAGNMGPTMSRSVGVAPATITEIYEWHG
jgi:hypothetical protein